MNPLVPGYTNMVLHFRPICDLNKEHFLSYANISQLLFLAVLVLIVKDKLGNISSSKITEVMLSAALS